MARPLSVQKRILFAAVPLFVLYLVCESVATAIAWSNWWDNSLWLFEESGRTWSFDPVRGYWLTKTPSRFCRITNGTIEFVGSARGNAQGFPDRDDFTAQRPASGGLRIAVFGDSFTEAQYLSQSWPDRAEDLARAQCQWLELLNFGVGGGGLANWWSTLTKVVAAERYEIDGVLFAVFPGDLRRTFSMWEHRGVVHPLFGRVPGWDPRTYPTTLAEARRFLKEHPATILSSEEFEGTLQGRWPRTVSRRLRPYFLTSAWRLVRSIGATAQELTPEPPANGDAARATLISDIRQFLRDREIPAVVVHIPDRSSLLDPAHAPRWPLEEARQFAADIGADFLDATPLYARLSRAQIRAQFLPYDGHWSQAGSNRFAEFVLQNLKPFQAVRQARSETGGTSPAR